MATVESVGFREVLVACRDSGEMVETVATAGSAESLVAPGAMAVPVAVPTVTVAMGEPAATAGSSAAPVVMVAPRARQAARTVTVATAVTAALSVALEVYPVALLVPAVTVETVASWEAPACAAAAAAKGA